jgi:hypothetical protein
MSSDSFTPRIRWQADADPAWELETSHDGFVNPEEAAFLQMDLPTRRPLNCGSMTAESG